MIKFNRFFLNYPFKRFMTTTTRNTLEHLQNRTLLRVSGPEVSNFLQGLITNDIQHLSSGPSSMYTLFLNNAGRILYDSIIYKTIENDTYLIECDKKISSNLRKHLKLYRVRRKIDVTDVSDELQIYVLYDSSKNYFGYAEEAPSNDPTACQKLNELVSQGNLFKKHDNFFIYEDPRITTLGSRIIANVNLNVPEILGQISEIKQESSSQNYRWLRYSLGVGEGIADLPPGECFPLECNGDFLHGVSFHKGCYIGQELTARVHHTGVVRKRLMPIYFTKIPSKSPDEKIIHENVNLGKLKGVEGDVGLALLRISKALSFKEIKIGDGIGITCKPNWWPVETPKEKISKSL